MTHRLRDDDTKVRRAALRALGRIAIDTPIPELPRPVGDLFTEFTGLAQDRRIALAGGLLRSGFFSGNRELLREMIEAAHARLADADLICAPYVAALDYLESDRAPAVLERQQPEMREAVQLLVEGLDRRHDGDQLESGEQSTK